MKIFQTFHLVHHVSTASAKQQWNCLTLNFAPAAVRCKVRTCCFCVPAKLKKNIESALNRRCAATACSCFIINRFQKWLHVIFFFWAEIGDGWTVFLLAGEAKKHKCAQDLSFHQRTACGLFVCVFYGMWKKEIYIFFWGLFPLLIKVRLL